MKKLKAASPNIKAEAGPNIKAEPVSNIKAEPGPNIKAEPGPNIKAEAGLEGQRAKRSKAPALGSSSSADGATDLMVLAAPAPPTPTLSSC